MLWKLSLTGLKSRFKDYVVLFSGLSLAAAIFYMFLTLALNPSFLKGNLVIAYQTTKVVFGVGIVLLALITLVYIIYANSFLLSMRKHDYGIYMMLGARNSKIGRLIFIETLVIGVLATIVGETIGILLTQVVSTILVKQLGLRIAHFIGFYLPAILWTLIFFAVLFALAAIWNSFKLRKTKVIDLIHEDQKSVKLTNHPLLRGLEAISGIVLLAIGYWAMYDYRTLQTSSVFIGFVTIVLGSYFLFSSVATAAINFLENRRKFSYKKLRVFTLGQLKFRLHSYNRILTVISLLFALALGAITVGLNFNNLTDQALEATYYDVEILSNNNQVKRQLKKVSVREKAQITYKTVVNKSKQTIYLSESQINHNNLKAQSYTMKDGQPVYKMISLNSKNLKSKNRTTKEDTYNYLLELVPASYDERYESELRVVSERKFDQINSKANNVEFLLVNNFKRNFNNIEKLQEYALPKNIDEEQKMQIMNNSKTSSYRDILMIASGFEFMGFFLGIAFLAMMASTLMFKVLSGAKQDQPRYQMLWKLGVQRKLLKRSISQEIGVLFALPAVLGIIDVLFGLQFFKGILLNPYDKIWIPFTIFLVLYLVYYVVTVKLYQSIVLKN